MSNFLFGIAIFGVAALFVVASMDAIVKESEWREGRYCDLYGEEINNHYGEDYCVTN